MLGRPALAGCPIGVSYSGVSFSERQFSAR